MIRSIVCSMCVVLFTVSSVQAHQDGDASAEPTGDTYPSVELRLWDEAAPGAKGDEPGDIPRMTVYPREDVAPAAAVVVLPGGGYGGLMTSYEGHDIARWFHSLGVVGVVCEYRTRGSGAGGEGYGHPYPLQDAQRAIRLLRAEADQFGVDPQRVGVIGFSAGGHLASTVATHFDSGLPEATDPVRQMSSRPDFAILCYPVIGFGKPYGHRGSERRLLGPNPDPIVVESLSTETQVTDQTPPTFLWHTAEDSVVPAENSIQFFLALQRKGVASELHVFERGRHGLGLAQDSPGADRWPELCRIWLQNHGFIEASQPGEATAASEAGESSDGK